MIDLQGLRLICASLFLALRLIGNRFLTLSRSIHAANETFRTVSFRLSCARIAPDSVTVCARFSRSGLVRSGPRSVLVTHPVQTV